MNQRKILFQMLPGFIPLFIFIIADEIWGTKIGLIVAVIVGIFELIYYGIKDKKFDKFILFDTLLLVALGIVSIIFDNDVFFKLKPALIGLLTSIILAFSAFTPNNFILSMSKRYMRGVEFNEQQYKLMKKSMKNMFYIFSIYTLLVFYSVWFMSKEAWAFISGGLFYIIFGIYFLYEFIKNKKNLKKKTKEDWLPIVNSQGDVIGSSPKSVCHSNKSYLHPVVHLYLINNKGEIFLKKKQTEKWDISINFHLLANKNIEESIFSKSFAEYGIKNFNYQLFSKYIWQSDSESEFVFCFLAKNIDHIIKINKEISEGKFWTINEITNNMGKNIFAEYFELEFQKFIRKFVIE